MLNPSRTCCCVASPCSCEGVTSSENYAPVNGTFIYEVQFPGSTGRVQLSQVVSGTDVRVTGLPNNADPNAGPTGGIYCNSTDCVDVVNSTTPCTVVNGLCDIPYGECNNPLITGFDYVFVDGPTFVEAVDFEITTTTCGFDLADDAGALIAFYITPFPNTCGTASYYICDDQCQNIVLYQTECKPAVYDIQDSVLPTFPLAAGGSGLCCPPYIINVVQTLPRLRVHDPYSTAGTLRFTWPGYPSTSFAASLTSSNPGPTGSPTISTQFSTYAHRNRSSSSCATSCAVPTFSNGSSCGACSSDACCCETEVCVAFTVHQGYDRMGFIGLNNYGVEASGSKSNFIKAFYRGCHDPRLYSEATVGLPSRTLKLDRAQVNLATLTLTELRASQYTKINAYSPPGDCIDAYGAAAVGASTSSVVDDRTCTCQPLGSANPECLALTRERALEIGIPETITVTRITP